MILSNTAMGSLHSSALSLPSPSEQKPKSFQWALRPYMIWTPAFADSSPNDLPSLTVF